MSEEKVITLNELHSGQIAVLDQAKRFNVLDCGRRWGKSELSKELLLDSPDSMNGALNGYPVAYFCPTYRMLMEVWRGMQDIVYDIIISKSETEKRIELLGGGVIDFWSLEDFNTIRGRKYKRAVIDEAAMVRYLKEAWMNVIRPTLTDLKGDAWFMSTPKGKNYFYELFNYPEKYEDWASWQMPTITNPFIDPVEIEAARLQLDPLTYAQEYLAEFVTDNLDSWAYCFSHDKHVGETLLDRKKEVILSFDFNRNPICCSVFQHYNNTVYGIETIKLDNSDIYKLCEYILIHYAGCLLVVTGDASGKSSSALVQDNINYYTVIKNKLRLAWSQIKVPAVNPKLEENKVLVNAILYNYKVILDKNRCKHLIFDLENVKVLPDGSIDKTDRKDPTKQADALDTLRYFCNTFLSWVLKT